MIDLLIICFSPNVERGSTGPTYHRFMLFSISVLFLLDGEPHPHLDAGAHHGQCGVPSDQKMWAELHVSLLIVEDHEYRTSIAVVETQMFIQSARCGGMQKRYFLCIV